MMAIKKNIDVDHKRTSTCEFIINACCMFMIIYNISIYGNTITAERVALVTLFLIMVFKQNFFFKISVNHTASRFALRLFISQVFLLAYSFIILSFGKGYHGTTITIGILRLLIFGGLFYIVMINLLHSVDELMAILFVVTLVQCVVICAGLVSPSIAHFLDTVVNNGLEFCELSFDVMRQIGYPSGISCITSWGVMKLSFGLIACAYYILKKENKGLYLFLFIFISAVGTAVARTMLVLSVVIFSLFYIFMMKQKNSNAAKIIFDVVLIIVLILIILNITGIVNKLPTIFKRLINLVTFGLQASFFDSYFHGTNTIIPPISIDTIIGTGIVSGTSANGVTVNADGEFVRMYTAIGLPLAVAFYLFLYGSIVKTCLSIKNKILKFLSFCFFAFLLIGEFKEYFIYESYMLPIFAVFFDLAMRKNGIEERN